jgi:hypothetical protein
VGEIGGNTWGVDNIIEGELVHEGAELEEKGQRLEWVPLSASIELVSVGYARESHKPVRYRLRRQRQLLRKFSSNSKCRKQCCWAAVTYRP